MSHSYEKHTWNVGEVITKALIDRMETGIDNAVDKSGDTISGNLDFIDPQSSDATRQKGRIVWDDYTNTTTGISYGRLKIQQFTNVPNLITSGTGKGYYTYNEEGKPIVDTYSFPQRLCEIAANESGKTYRIFTSNGTVNGAAYWDSGTATDNDLQYGILPLKYGGLGFVPTANGALYVNTDGQGNKVITVATLPVIRGGTGLTTVPENYLLLGGSATNVPLKTLAPGNNGQVLKIVNGAPTWAADSTTPYPYTEYTSATNNGITTATFTINNRTVWNDGRVARIGNILQFFTRNTVPIVDGDQNVVVTDLTTKYSNAIIVGDYTNQFVFREHHITGEGVENYYLPAPTNENPPKQDYDILTSKHYLPAEYGRLAALKFNDTTNTFVRDYAVFGAFGAFDSRVVNQLSKNSNIVIPSNSDHVAQSQGVWVTGTFKTQYCYVTGNPPMFTDSTIDWGSLPALNLRYTKISNLSAQVQRNTEKKITQILLPANNLPQYEDVTLASFRARHVTTGNSWEYRWPMGTERQAVIDVVTYVDDNFANASGYGNNKRGNFAFHLPTCKWSEWVTAYNNSSASTKDTSFGVHYSILTTKNYYMYSDTITLKNDITIANSHQVLGTIQYQNFSFPDLDYQGVATLADLAETSTLGGGLILSVRNKGGSGCEIWGYTNGNTTVLKAGTKIDFIGMHTIPETWNSDDNA